MAFVELSEADQWLYSTFTGDATLMSYLTASGVYSTYAPPLTTGKYLVYQVQSPGNDVHASGRLGTGRIMSTPLYLCRIVGAANDWASLEAAALRMDVLIEGVDATTTNGNHIAVQRESPYQAVNIQGPQQRWRELGGLYRLYISGA